MLLDSLLGGHHLLHEGLADIKKFNHEVVLPHIEKFADKLDNDLDHIIQDLSGPKDDQAQAPIDETSIPVAKKWGKTETAVPDPDIKYTIQQIIEEHGFGYQEYIVNTEDGCVRKTFGPFGSVCLMRVRAHRNESAAMDVDHYSVDFFGQLLSHVL